MANTEQKREIPPWIGAVAIVIVLIGIVLYGIHVLRPQAPNSDFKTPTSYHSPSPPASAAPVAH